MNFVCFFSSSPPYLSHHATKKKALIFQLTENHTTLTPPFGVFVDAHSQSVGLELELLYLRGYIDCQMCFLIIFFRKDSKKFSGSSFLNVEKTTEYLEVVDKTQDI